MSQKEWIYNKVDTNEKSLIKRLLNTRGITSDDDIQEFMHPLEMKLTQPEAFCDMVKSVERISKAIDNKENIVIYGDFDADGITSTSLLYKTLKHVGAEVNYYIPDREKDGHGLNTTAIINIMKDMKPKLIITVDCGISNIDEVKFLKSFKIDTIITDHHEAPDTLPEALAIINPKAPNSIDEKMSSKQITYLSYLAGVGVAFKLAQALLNYYNKLEFIKEILPFVAVGTVGDVVPLIGENRYFVTKGIELISSGKHYGLKRLLESSKFNSDGDITSETIAFGIVPRINASSRVDTTNPAVKLLISDNKQEIELAIQSLNEFNKVRQTLEQNIFEEADEMVQKEENKYPAIVLFNEKWQVGVIGIVASKLVEKYYQPTFLLLYSEETKQIKCSARSIDGVHLYETISTISDLLDGFGGHALAAGLSFSPEKVPFKTVKDELIKAVKEVTEGRELKPYIKIDMELDAGEITPDLTDELSKLEPFGASNPAPVFSLCGAKLKQKKLMGNNKNHLRLTVEKDGKELTCIRWKDGDINLDIGAELDIAFHPSKNVYNDNVYVQLIVHDIHSPELKEAETDTNQEQYKIYDHRKKTDILQQVNDYVQGSKLNIKIFAENKQIKDKLSNYKALTQNIKTRDDIDKCDSLMFFDYPADKETFNEIISTASPKQIHFMNYDIKYFDDKEFLKLISGMIKFAVNNNNGKIDLIRCASYLGKSVRMIREFLNLLNECNIIKLTEVAEKYYTVKDFLPENINNIVHNQKSAEIINIAEECEHFQESLLYGDIDEVKDIILV